MFLKLRYEVKNSKKQVYQNNKYGLSLTSKEVCPFFSITVRLMKLCRKVKKKCCVPLVNFCN